MTPTIRINEGTKEAINQLGGTFDSPDDVIQRLIEEAEYGHLLSEDSETSEYDHRERKRAFRQRVKDELNVTELGKVTGMRTAWKYETSTGIKHLWLHADKNNDYWGWPKEPPEEVVDKPVIHVFLGPDSDNCYVVPHEDVMGRFDLTESNKQIQLHRKNQPELFNQYRSLESIVEYQGQNSGT
jgi:hypothetical protein